MLTWIKLIFLALCLIVMDESTGSADEDFLWDTFPKGFRWGVSTSSYQIEGGWNADGKGESVWDRFCHQGGRVKNNDTGDVACDSYHRYEEDIACLKKLGVQFYRFSLSWPRILPDGTLKSFNKAGVDYYNRLITRLTDEGIKPLVTLFHWDLPQALQDTGGWLNPDIKNYFNDYATLCFEKFGDRVKLWTTINEPVILSLTGYGNGQFAPGVVMPGVGSYQAGHNMLLAHALAWRTYDEVFRQKQGGKIACGHAIHWNQPFSYKAEDKEAAERMLQFMAGWFAHPIHVNGDYPQVMKDFIGRKSEREGRKKSRLPEFTNAEKQLILGTHDFFPLSHYTTMLAENSDMDAADPSWFTDCNVKSHIDPTWPSTGSSMFFEVPWGMRKTLAWINDQYGNPEVIILENGMADGAERYGSLNDEQRIRFIKGYANNVLKAVKLDGCNVTGYSVWSMMDNFEWVSGYEARFGLYQVDFNDPNRARVPKASVGFYANLIKNNGWMKMP